MDKKEQILHYHRIDGLSQREIARRVGVSRKTVKPDVHYGIYIREDHEIYTDDFIRKAFVLLNEAQQMADDDEVRQRVDRVRMQPLYLHCVRHKVASRQDGTWQELKKLLLKYNARPGEVRPLDKFIQEFESLP